MFAVAHQDVFRRLTNPTLKKLYRFVLKRLVGRFLNDDIALEVRVYSWLHWALLCEQHDRCFLKVFLSAFSQRVKHFIIVQLSRFPRVCSLETALDEEEVYCPTHRAVYVWVCPNHYFISCTRCRLHLISAGNVDSTVHNNLVCTVMSAASPPCCVRLPRRRRTCTSQRHGCRLLPQC